MLTPLLILFSCNEQESFSPAVSEAVPIEKLRAEVHEVAYKKWQEFQKKHEPVVNILKDDPSSSECNCYYVIDEVNYKPTNVEIDFFSNTECVPGDPFECRYFSALYFSGPVCGSFINPDCGEYWPSAPPPGLFPFKCNVSKFSTFDINGFAGWVDENCWGGYTSWTITFRIICEDTNFNEPGSCGQQSYVSDPITISGTPLDNHDQVFVQLRDCGCVPTLLQ